MWSGNWWSHKLPGVVIESLGTFRLRYIWLWSRASTPWVYIRLSMDIGLGKFLEMFEERFGRKATTVLLGIIALGITGGMLNLIYQYLFTPLMEAFLIIQTKGLLNFLEQIVLADVARFFIFMILSGLLLYILGIIGGELYIRVVSNRWRRIVQQRHDSAEKLIGEIDTLLDRLNDLNGQAKERLADIQNLEIKVKEGFARLKPKVEDLKAEVDKQKQAKSH
jgi:hypothetical protein